MNKLENREKLSNINKNYKDMNGKEVLIAGWIRNLRDSKKISLLKIVSFLG